MRAVLWYAVLLLLIIASVWVAYRVLEPMPFLFATGLVLCLLYFGLLYFTRKDKSRDGQQPIRLSQLLSVVMLLLLFGVSLKVLKDYQLPKGKSAYFTNIDYHVIRNYGIAFENKLELYVAEADSANGIWTSPSGHFRIEEGDSSAANFTFNNFFIPVFGVTQKNKKTVQLLNPVYKDPVQNGFRIGDSLTSITWVAISAAKKKDNHVFNFRIIFATRDRYLLDTAVTPATAFTDTAYVDNLTLNKGLDLKSIFRNAIKKPVTANMVMQWIDRYSKCYLLNDATAFGDPQLLFFPSYDFYVAGTVSKNGERLAPQLSSHAPFTLSEQFYVGLENERKKYAIRKLTTEEQHFTGNANYALTFSEIAYFPFKSSEPDQSSMGKDKLRFLKNNYRQLTYNEIREGFLFHDDTKQNGYTDFDAMIRYSAGPAGNALDYELVAGGAKSSGDGKFGIKSSNGALTWLFSIEDFSKNGYDLGHLSKYLAVLLLAMLALIIFRPGVNILFVETPVLMIVYMLMVFRFLLLWRIATFPPLNGISNNEFNTLLYFDLKEFTFFPFSLFVVITCLVAVFIYRSKRVEPVTGTNRTVRFQGLRSLYQKTVQFINASPLLFHGLMLVLAAGCQVLIRAEVLTRMLSIALPVASYFLCSYIIVKKESRYHEKERKFRSKYIQSVYRFLFYWIDSPIFLLSLFTLGYLFVFDAGFGILFLFFLLFKNLLFAFNRRPENIFPNKKAHFLNPARYWIYGGIYFVIYLVAISYKKAFYYLLENKIAVAAGALLLTTAAIYFLWYPVTEKLKKVKKAATWGLLLITILLIIPTFLQDFVNKVIEDKTRLVKYRTTILTDPVENMLLNYKYNSSKEQKIIETAQGQWFINIYLNTETDGRLINLREHFNKGVDYSTQTRDVIVPRFIIAEFGGLMLCLLLLTFGLPLVLFFLRYQLASDRKSYFHVGSYTGAMSVIMLVTLAVFVWLTATNRFVFFGQDFPFLSLTSKLSTILPMILVVALLTSHPKPRNTQRHDIRLSAWRWIIFGFFLVVVIFVSGKSNLISEDRFKVDFTKVLNRVDSINNLLGNIQMASARGYRLSPTLLKEHPEKFMHNVRQLLDTLYQHDEFNEIYDRATVYERSMLDSLKLNPAFGFKISSPLHVKYDGSKDLISLTFNQHFHLENPPYNIKKVWKGDIEEETRLYVQDVVPKKYGTYHRKIIVVPSSFQAPGEPPVALLYLHFFNNDECHIYNKKNEQIKVYRHQYAVARLTPEDVVLFFNKNGGKITPWTMYGDKHYFAYNMTINGRQRHIYPMGDLLFWVRDWKDANMKYYESIRDYQRNAALSLDYELNRKVNEYLQRNCRAIKKDEPELSFSVVVADGNGQIRLMADYVAQREIIDPNDEVKVARKKSEQYFNVDSRAERLQWGNLNLLHMTLGPGSSIKPIVAAAVTSGLKAEWPRLQFKASEDTLIGGALYTKYYAGLRLAGKGWKIGVPGNSTNQDVNFVQYLSRSNNWYHSLIVFLGSYNREAFLANGAYSLTNQLSLTRNGNNASRFPVMALGTGTPYYFHDPQGWPLTNQNNDNKPSYFGSSTSLLANGLRKNFYMQINPSNRYNSVAARDSFSTVLPDTITNKNIWASPEASYFFQDNRVSDNLIENFNKGLRNPTLGGDPFIITPLGMLELFGKLASYNRLYKVTIDKRDGGRRSDIDPDVTWQDTYPMFLTSYIYEGMKSAVASGTAAPLTGGQFNYNGYYLYAKTGTIGNSDDENSKRLALIIAKEPFNENNLRSNPFYVVYFTIGHAFENDATDKNWFWPFYKKILDDIMRSNSFKKFMK